ncbi:MAG TPA: HAMP domain-containing sensor histidine kinase [Pyrinomonadaceae bacterium]|mgnify:CR=1 FL=1|nr:HAMP domain-containing sensor histidine kinase [Pyrinomonadaceae bacterium]
MRRKKTAIFFLVLGIGLSILAVALNVGWILLNLREVVLLVLGVIFFALIITGLILNTIFLVREIRRNEQHDAFINAVTHELKTPIASIKLYLETMKRRDVSPEKQKEFLDVMLADSDRLLTTVEQVLKAGGLKEKLPRPANTEISLAELLKQCIATVRAQRNLDPSAIRFTEPATPMEVRGDEAELTTAFTNLLDNAVKYSTGEPKISVRIKETVLNKRAEIFIKDNGVGIPSSDLKRIFKRFYRVANGSTGKTPGTGLGLFIVRTIVERHGGRVFAQSRGEGKGSTFVVQLPLA